MLIGNSLRAYALDNKEPYQALWYVRECNYLPWFTRYKVYDKDRKYIATFKTFEDASNFVTWSMTREDE